MYKVTAYFRDHKVSQKFYDMYDAIDWRDSADAHYPKDVKFEKVNDMREFVYTSWNSVMNAEVNPLRHIPDLQARHMVLQVLAWMWCIVFSFYVGSFWVFGVSAVAHVALLGAIAVTVGTFELAKINLHSLLSSLQALLVVIEAICGLTGKELNYQKKIQAANTNKDSIITQTHNITKGVYYGMDSC